jgi:hypothetical protein
MTRQSLSLGLVLALALAAVLVVASPAAAQSASSGAAAAAPASTPRLANGKPSLAGMWVATGEDVRDFIPVGGKPDEKGNLQEMFRARPCHPGMRSCHAAVNQSTDSTFTARMNANRPLYKPEFWDRVQYLDAHTNWEDPVMTCVPQGIPRVGAPRKIMQTDDEVVFIYGSDFRIIPTDGRPHDPIKSQDLYFNGHAVGRWEGDTLVVDSVAFNDITWLDRGGYFHSNNMKVTERFRREGNQMHYQVIVTDPDVLLEPWTMDPQVLRVNPNPRATIDEPMPCEERDREHMVGKTHH